MLVREMAKKSIHMKLEGTTKASTIIKDLTNQRWDLIIAINLVTLLMIAEEYS